MTSLPADDVITVELRRDEVEWLETAARHASGDAVARVLGSGDALEALARKLDAAARTIRQPGEQG